LGKTISEGREFDLDDRGRKLMDSLRNITGAEIYKTTDFVSLSRDDALKMCSTLPTAIPRSSATTSMRTWCRRWC
jgi:hypothetical protein